MTTGLIFQELITGEGAYIGFIILASVMVLVTLKVKVMGILFMAVTSFLSIYCFGLISADSDLIWIAILYAINNMVLLMSMYKGGNIF